MENSVFIAKLFSIVYLSIGIGMIVDPKFYKSVFRDYQERASLVYFGGILALVSGFLVVHFHNHWQPGWQIVITVIGWIGLVKGVLLLIYPQLLVKHGVGKLMYRFAVVASILLGGYLGFFGFLAG